MAQPTIDSMRVVSQAHRLEVFGNFSDGIGEVTIDGVSSIIHSWSDSLIVVSLIDTGKGSCGPVIVSDRQGRSEERNITRYTGVWSYSHGEKHSIFSFKGRSYAFEFRIDLHSIVAHKLRGLSQVVDARSSIGISSSHGTQYDPRYGYDTYWDINSTLWVKLDTPYTEGFQGIATVSIGTRELSLLAYNIQGVTEQITFVNRDTGEGSITQSMNIDPFEVSVSLGPSLDILDFDSSFVGPGESYYDHFEHLGTIAFPPPDSLLSLVDAPILKNTFVASTGVILGWLPVRNIDSYEVQLARDIAFDGPVQALMSNDTGTAIPLIDPGMYFVRVRATNRYGSTPWSSVAQFEFQPASVIEERTSQPYQLIGDELHNRDEVARVFRIYDLLGRLQGEVTVPSRGKVDLGHFDRPMILHAIEGGVAIFGL